MSPRGWLIFAFAGWGSAIWSDVLSGHVNWLTFDIGVPAMVALWVLWKSHPTQWSR